MQWGLGWRANGAPCGAVSAVLVAFAAFALSGCNTTGNPTASIASRGASVAFDSIDGAPPALFRKLVRDLNDEAQTRRVAISAREGGAAYRVRGYLAMQKHKGGNTVSWLWDVYDADQQRAMRISGEESVKGRHADVWNAVDDEIVRRIASRSMDQLSAFLTSPGAAPVDAQSPAAHTSFSPESFGIFRVSAPQLDPVDADAQDGPDAGGNIAGPVPLPVRRPTAALSAAQTLTLAAAHR